MNPRVGGRVPVASNKGAGQGRAFGGLTRTWHLDSTRDLAAVSRPDSRPPQTLGTGHVSVGTLVPAGASHGLPYSARGKRGTTGHLGTTGHNQAGILFYPLLPSWAESSSATFWGHTDAPLLPFHFCSLQKCPDWPCTPLQLRETLSPTYCAEHTSPTPPLPVLPAPALAPPGPPLFDPIS